MTNTAKRDAEASFLSKIGTNILKTKLIVQWLDESNELGYTSLSTGREKTVHVTWYNKTYMELLDESKQMLMRMGIFFHELLHQCFTNFRYTNTVLKDMTRAEGAVFMKFANTIEDPAIEYFAANATDNQLLLDALHFSIKQIYIKSPAIDKSPSAFTQLINAMINFGDMGFIKGDFTYPEAREYFTKIAPLYNEAIVCPNSKTRIDIAKQCMDLTKPLWEEDVKNEELLEQMLSELAKALKSDGMHAKQDEEESMQGGDSQVSQTRSDAVEAITKAGKEADGNGKDADGNSKSAGNGDGGSTDGKDTSGMPDLTKSEEDANNAAETAYVIDEKAIKPIENMLTKNALKQMKKDGVQMPAEELKNYDISSSHWGENVTCFNTHITADSSDKAVYAEMVSHFNPEIKILTKSLSHIFESDMEVCNRATSGDYNILRGTIGTTARIFDKTRDPGYLKNAAVELLFDISGSMEDNGKIDNARKTAIVFAEALSALHIPYYILGFTADVNGYNAYHCHYVDWNNRKTDRESLVQMTAMANNFDGYSIRYAAKLLQERKEEHKLLIIVSDGIPLCRSYKNMNDGMIDTINAIKDARKIGTTFGIAVGKSCDSQILQKMYGKDFIHCNTTELTRTLGKKLTKLFQK